MPAMEDTVKEAIDSLLKDQIRILVGGAPVTADFAHNIGADGYAENGAEAADVANKLIGYSKPT